MVEGCHAQREFVDISGRMIRQTSVRVALASILEDKIMTERAHFVGYFVEA